MVEIKNGNESQQELNQGNQEQGQQQEGPAKQDDFSKLDKAGQVEPQGFNAEDYIGFEKYIESIEERVGEYGFYIVIKTERVDDGNKEIRASKMFGLQQDEEGNWGWSPESKLFHFLQKMGVNHYSQLVGNPQYEILKDNSGNTYRRITGDKVFIVKLQVDQNKKGKQFLAF